MTTVLTNRKQRGRRVVTLAGDSFKRSPLAKPRAETRNTGDPRGQFGAYLRHWVDQHLDGDEKRLADKLEISDRTIRQWMHGQHGPAFADLGRIAKAMGFADWDRLAIAIVRFSSKT